MERQQVTLINDSPMVMLSPDLLDRLGIKIGDEVEIAIENSSLVLRPLNGKGRKAFMDEAMRELMERRRVVYERLAEGVK